MTMFKYGCKWPAVSAPLVLLAACLAGAPPAIAHEFWLDVVVARPAKGASVPVVFRNGQELLGDSYPYLKAATRRFSVIDAKGERRIKAIEGDDPAADVPFPNAGLAIVVYQGASEDTEFASFEKFSESVLYEGLAAVLEAHRSAGKPMTRIRERYMRCAKALVGVGDGKGTDRAVGLPLELVALDNPYQLAPGQQLTVQVLRDGRPLAGAVVKTFHRQDPLSPRSVTAGTDGKATIALPQPGFTLVHAVHMQEPAPGDKSHWSSLWASLTFYRP